MVEAAKIDGCSDTKFFFRIVLHLSAVGRWNEYFNAFLYLSDKALYPLQLVLHDILVSNQISVIDIQDDAVIAGRQGIADLLKYSLIVSSLQVILMNPLVQKHFVKGVMIGSVKVRAERRSDMVSREEIQKSELFALSSGGL